MGGAVGRGEPALQGRVDLGRHAAGLDRGDALVPYGPARLGDGAGGAAEGDAAQPLGMVDRQVLADHAADREADEGHALDLQMIEQADDVERHDPVRIAAIKGLAAGATNTTNAQPLIAFLPRGVRVGDEPPLVNAPRRARTSSLPWPGRGVSVTRPVADHPLPTDWPTGPET